MMTNLPDSLKWMQCLGRHRLNRGAITHVGLVAVLFLATPLYAQFSSGSDGSDGALAVTGNRVLDLPDDGRFNFTTVTIEEGATLSFNPNPKNTPVYVLASGSIIVNGTVHVNGGTGDSVNGGVGGPGGYGGGQPGFNELPPGAGLGPGGGLGGAPNRDGAGPGAYLNAGNNTRDENLQQGVPYGTPLLVPMVGGSGGGGTAGSPGVGGGGGGGALLMASDESITVGQMGRIEARGGSDGDSNDFFAPKHGGSGGAVRLVAPLIQGTGQVNVEAFIRGFAGDGRIRIDAVDRRQFNLELVPARSVSVGVLMAVDPGVLPRLDILQVADQVIPEGSVPPETFILPIGSPAEQIVRVQARDFRGLIPILVRLIPENGVPVDFEGTIDMATGNPATTDVAVTLPLNTGVRVQVWTRDAEE